MSDSGFLGSTGINHDAEKFTITVADYGISGLEVASRTGEGVEGGFFIEFREVFLSVDRPEPGEINFVEFLGVREVEVGYELA